MGQAEKRIGLTGEEGDEGFKAKIQVGGRLLDVTAEAVLRADEGNTLILTAVSKDKADQKALWAFRGQNAHLLIQCHATIDVKEPKSGKGKGKGK